MTRTLPPHRLDFGRDVAGGQPTDIGGGGAQLPDKAAQTSAGGLANGMAARFAAHTALLFFL
jgi:hypothetical protein